MQIAQQLELDVPRAYAFERFTNIQEISANLPANIVLRPEKGAYEMSVGSVWVIKAQRSGRNFVVRNKVVKNQFPESLAFESSSNRTESEIEFTFEELAPEKTRINMNFDVKPKGLLGRILVQSMKASKKRIDDGFEKGFNRIRPRIEADYQSHK